MTPEPNIACQDLRKVSESSCIQPDIPTQRVPKT